MYIITIKSETEKGHLFPALSMKYGELMVTDKKVVVCIRCECILCGYAILVRNVNVACMHT